MNQCSDGVANFSSSRSAKYENITMAVFLGMRKPYLELFYQPIILTLTKWAV